MFVTQHRALGHPRDEETGIDFYTCHNTLKTHDVNELSFVNCQFHIPAEKAGHATSECYKEQMLSKISL